MAWSPRGVPNPETACPEESIDTERYERVKRLFIEALEQPAAVRADFVTHSAEDTSLCAEVLALLREHHEAGGPDAQGPAHTLHDRVGPFRIVALLGRGGMGLVYRAERPGGGPVALKVLESGVLSGRLIGRFRREAEALRRLDHPGIARFLEAGSYDSPVGPRPYFAMELVEGESLRQRARDESWAERDRIALLADLAEALHHAHEHGIIHRDLKPENVVVTATGKPKVLDFGVARITADDMRGGTLATGTGVLLGTIRYMSPEQAQGLTDEVDRRSDVYTLGVMAFELLSGSLPYELHTRSVTRALVQVATVAPRPLGEMRPSLRGPVERIVSRALAKDPADRYPTAAELAADLRRHLAGDRVRAPGPSLNDRASRLVRNRPWHLAAGSLGALLVVALAGWTVWSWRSPARTAEADAATYRACALLDSVDFRLHHAQRTPQSIQRALALLNRAAVEIRRLARRGYAADLRRYAAWREGEAWYFLAEMGSDPDLFLRAAYTWERAREPVRPAGYRPGLPDTTVNIHPRLIRHWPHQADAGIALAFTEVAREREPARFSRLALRHNRAAWGTFAAETGVDLDPLRFAAPRHLAPVGARLLNDLGASTAALGFYEDSLDLIDAGIRLCRHAAQTRGLDDEPAAAASLDQHLGQAWLWRGRMSHEPANLDSAIAHLERALGERAGLPGSTSVFESRESLAEALRLRARRHAPESDPARWIERSLGIIRGGLESPATRPGPAHAARIRIALAAAMVDAAVLGRDPATLDSADSLLSAVAGLFSRPRFPFTFARIERERGRIAAARWLLTRESRYRAAAIAQFAAAADALTEGHHRPFRREADGASRWLSAHRDHPPSWTDPVLMP